jgi:hypothetical protein
VGSGEARSIDKNCESSDEFSRDRSHNQVSMKFSPRSTDLCKALRDSSSVSADPNWSCQFPKRHSLLQIPGSLSYREFCSSFVSVLMRKLTEGLLEERITRPAARKTSLFCPER